LKGLGLRLGVEKSGVEISFNPFAQHGFTGFTGPSVHWQWHLLRA
jgi:hypothetical protein